MHDQALLVRANEYKMALAPRHVVPQRNPSRLLHRFGQQSIRLVPPLVGTQKVRLFDVDEVDTF